jgi:hypothetical protein
MKLEAPSPIVCFLDESATDDQRTDHAVLGGMLINRSHIPEFEELWQTMLTKYAVVGGVHISAFGPKGSNAHIAEVDCEALYREAVEIINRVKIAAFGCSLDNRKIERAFDTAVRDQGANAYGLAFLMCVTVNSETAAAHNYRGEIDYVLDEGNRFRRHVEGMHRTIRESEELKRFRVGTIAFDSDSKVLALQAADVIAWATRRRSSSGHFNDVLNPLTGLFNDSYVESPLPDGPLRELSESLARSQRGTPAG